MPCCNVANRSPSTPKWCVLSEWPGLHTNNTHVAPSPYTQANARTAAHAIANIVAQGDVSLCITHGNGPQVGLLAEQDPTTPLDVLGAESEGQIGYLVELELQSVLPQHQFCALLTKTVVDPHDPAFDTPTKYIGPMYTEQQAQQLQTTKQWVMKADGNKGWRRVVASPTPIAVQEAPSIAVLLEHGIVTICCGGL